MSKRPQMRRDGTSFFPRVRGSSESISRAGGAEGIPQERPKTMKENEIMKSRKIIFTTVLSTLVCCGLCQQVQSATDTPDPGPLPVSNTADGQLALAGVTGIYNSGFGIYAGLSNGAANFNTAIGGATLLSNTANEQTGVGAAVLFSNTTGGANTGVGAFALFSNVDGSDNNAVGDRALQSNVSGFFNNAHGHEALFANDGDQNNAFGDLALFDCTTGSFNTAVGDDALFSVTTGNSNTALGDEAGSNLIDGEGNIYIGAQVQAGGTGEFEFIRIGNDTAFTFPYDTFIAGIFNRAVSNATAQFVFVDDTGKLGTVLVDAVGNKAATPQAMLNESRDQQKRIAELEGTVARLAAMVKEQAAQIQKVSAQLEVGKPATKVALENQ